MEHTRQPIKEERGNDRKTERRRIQKGKKKKIIRNKPYKTIINIWSIRCYRLNFEFISVLSICVYTCSYLLFIYKGECGMTSLYAVTYMYSINSSYDSFVPVKDATARNHADLFINL